MQTKVFNHLLSERSQDIPRPCFCFIIVDNILLTDEKKKKGAESS